MPQDFVVRCLGSLRILGSATKEGEIPRSSMVLPVDWEITKQFLKSELDPKLIRIVNRRSQRPTGLPFLLFLIRNLNLLNKRRLLHVCLSEISDQD